MKPLIVNLHGIVTSIKNQGDVYIFNIDSGCYISMLYDEIIENITCMLEEDKVWIEKFRMLDYICNNKQDLIYLMFIGSYIDCNVRTELEYDENIEGDRESALEEFELVKNIDYPAVSLSVNAMNKMFVSLADTLIMKRLQ